MCPGILIDCEPEVNISDDEFDRHGRIRRRTSSSSSSQDFDHGQIVVSPAELDDHIDEPLNNPSQTSPASGGGAQELDDQASQTFFPIRPQEQEGNANAGENHPTPSNPGTFWISFPFDRTHPPNPPFRENPRGYIHRQIGPILGVLRTCLQVTEQERSSRVITQQDTWNITLDRDLRVISSIVGYLQVIENLADQLS
ncbi:hypothetical protein F5Y12DRAFT_796959 [Xylaria sp. FL1777]|nr:hypothetical protein F5Y12DRAFT_796959 [Xylaria sp. FL1777]